MNRAKRSMSVVTLFAGKFSLFEEFYPAVRIWCIWGEQKDRKLTVVGEVFSCPDTANEVCSQNILPPQFGGFVSSLVCFRHRILSPPGCGFVPTPIEGQILSP